MLSRVRASVRRMPAAPRLIAVAALLLVAATASLAARSEAPARWVPLLVVAVAGAVVAGAPKRLWPLPAIWVVATLLVTTSGATIDGATTVVSALVGTVALVVAVVIDLVPVIGHRRRART